MVGSLSEAELLRQRESNWRKPTRHPNPYRSMTVEQIHQICAPRCSVDFPAGRAGSGDNFLAERAMDLLCLFVFRVCRALLPFSSRLVLARA